MSRRTWRKGSLSISYGKPSITPHGGMAAKTMDDAMYFYYGVSILSGNKVMVEYSAYDFPKVQDLPVYIDDIVNYDMSKAYLLEDFEWNGFERKRWYHQTLLEDSFQFDMEYYYKFERYDYSVKQSGETVPETWTEYTLTIGGMAVDKKYHGANRENYGQTITIKHLTNEDLLALKHTAEEFCKEALRLNAIVYKDQKGYE